MTDLVNTPTRGQFLFRRGLNAFIEEESEDKYTSDGFFPVRIGNIYATYRIVRKLGCGSYSTIWLAEDARSPLLPTLLMS